MNTANGQDRPFYDAVYSALVEIGGANELERDGFVDYFTSPREHSDLEWRFRGKLGFGGKFYRGWEQFYVAYYPENHTPARDEIEARLNHRIAGLIETMRPLCGRALVNLMPRA